VIGTIDASVGGMQDTTTTTWKELLAMAASRCDEDPDTFMRAATLAYFEARPGMMEHLEELHLRAQLDELRKEGRIGLA